MVKFFAAEIWMLRWMCGLTKLYRIINDGQRKYDNYLRKFRKLCLKCYGHLTRREEQYVLSHVITNNKSPTKHSELDSASCRAAKELSEGTNQVSLGQLLTAQ